MASSLTIGHPTSDRPVTSLGFVASGTGPPRGKVRGVLISLGPKWNPKTKPMKVTKVKGLIYPGTTLVQPPNWALGFRVKSAGFYMLVVTLVGAGPLTAASVVFRVKARRGSGGSHGLSMSFPANNDHVQPSFFAYGTYNNETSVSGTMTCGNVNAHVFNAGPTPVSPPLTLWYIGFQIPNTGQNAEPDADNPFVCRVEETGNPGNNGVADPVYVDNLP